MKRTKLDDVVDYVRAHPWCAARDVGLVLGYSAMNSLPVLTRGSRRVPARLVRERRLWIGAEAGEGNFKRLRDGVWHYAVREP